MRVFGTGLRPGFLAILAMMLVVAGAPVGAQTLIPLPMDDAADVIDNAEFDRLNADRIDPERHRGNHVELVAFDPSVISPLRPIEARGRPAGTAIRFDGESRVLEFALFVPEPSQMRGLRVTTLSSINVLPERSRFRVYINVLNRPVQTRFRFASTYRLKLARQS